jgi:Na+/H+ antiporter NhaA
VSGSVVLLIVFYLLRFCSKAIFLIAGLVIWFAFFESGIHAALAGVWGATWCYAFPAGSIDLLHALASTPASVANGMVGAIHVPRRQPAGP